MTAGIECRKDTDVIDKTLAAHKDNKLRMDLNLGNSIMHFREPEPGAKRDGTTRARMWSCPSTKISISNPHLWALLVP